MRAGDPLHCDVAMAKVCHSCGKKPAFGQSRSHSMRATKRRFNPNLQKVRVLDRLRPAARLRLHALPEGREGPEGPLGPDVARRSRGDRAGATLDVHGSEPRPLPCRRRRRARAPRVAPPGDQRSQRLPRRRRRHGRQHGAHAQRRARRGRPARRRHPLARRPQGTARRLDEIGRDEIVESVARAALLGARGNSGVILSQLIRGAAEELVSRPGELVDPVLIGAAMARAAQRAYSSVREPAEGTILTVVRDMATCVASEIAHMGDTRLGAEGDPAVQNALIADVLERALRAGEESVRRGPEHARRAARERRRRRRRPRADGDLRGHDRRAARHRGARRRAPRRARPRHPPRARVLDVSLLHELRGHRPRPRSRPLDRARSRRSATRCSSSATRRR